jgi:hypothetical protein
LIFPIKVWKSLKSAQIIILKCGLNF